MVFDQKEKLKYERIRFYLLNYAWVEPDDRFQFPAIVAQQRRRPIRMHLSLTFLCHIQFNSYLDDC